MHKLAPSIQTLLLILGLVAILAGCNTPESTSNHYINQITQHRLGLDTFFRTSKNSPFYSQKNFNKLHFFDVDPSFLFKIPLQTIENPQIVQFETNTEKKPVYLKQYKLAFEFNNKPYNLMGYVSSRNPQILFIPFKDLTNSNETYGGGRYLELILPESDSIDLDFNLAFNPYCHYDTGYACPLVPRENYLDFAVKAGEKIYKH